MSEFHVSPLLDAMTVGDCFARHDGVACYTITHPESGREFVLKHISVPASGEQVQALLLTGAYQNEAEADEYYRKEAEALVREAEERKKLLDCPYILPFLGIQMEKKAEGVGYDVYAVLPKRNSLQSYLEENAVSHLRGINMGIDLCVALSAMREEGYIHANLKPGNVFFSDTGRFLVGDFGLISTQDLQYAVLPEQYRSGYNAPELRTILGGMNLTVDIYSLGMILYRIYNGNHAPFEDEQTNAKAADARRVEGEALPAPLYADYELAAIILKACAFRPEDRYQDPEALRVELEQYMRRNAVSDHPIVPPLVTDGATLTPEEASEEAEPVSFTDKEDLPEDFRRSFSPDEKRNRRKKPDPAPDPTPVLSDPTPLLTAERQKKAEKAKQRRKRRRAGWISFAALMMILVVFIGLYEFTDLGQGLWHYFVTVDKLEVSDVTADSMRLNLSTNVNPDDFTALCQDAYGNSFRGTFEDGAASFTGLNPGTQYTLKVSLEGLHKVSGATSVTAATKPRAEILTFTATDGTEAGMVLLDLVVKDENTEPASWTLGYTREGGEEKTVTFTGHQCQLNGLEPGASYRFRLIETGDLYLAGQLETALTLLREVKVEDLQLDQVRDGTALISWNCPTELPEKWELTCTDPDGMSLPVTVNPAQLNENSYYCSAVIENVVPGVNYTLRLTALGMFQPLSLEMADLAVYLNGLEAQTEPGFVTLTWSPSRVPEGGWVVTAVTAGDEPLELSVEENSCRICVLPDADYELTLRAADGSAINGEASVTVHTRDAQRISLYGVSGSGTTIGTYQTPTKENWTASDLRGGTVRYHSDDSITFLVSVRTNPQDVADEVTVHYVVRDNSGNVLHTDRVTAAWNSLWQGRQWYDQIPWLPETAGRYSFTTYINGQRVGTINFTILA